MAQTAKTTGRAEFEIWQKATGHAFTSEVKTHAVEDGKAVCGVKVRKDNGYIKPLWEQRKAPPYTLNHVDCRRCLVGLWKRGYTNTILADE